MEAEKPISQIIRLKEVSALAVAQRYYRILSAVSNVGLTEREIQLLAFTAIRGNMSYSTNRQDFIDTYKSSSATINNIISKLKNLGLLVKEGTKVKVNPTYILDFNKNLKIEVNLQNG